MKTQRVACFVLVILSSCAEGVGDVDANSGVTPVDPDLPTVTIVEPLDDIDGEYVMRMEPVSLVCNGEVLEEQPTLHALANVVEQNNVNTFDLLARGSGGYYDFTHWGIDRKANGLFEDEDSFEWYITPGYPPLVFLMTAIGSVFSDSLAFVNHWDIGWYDDDGVWHPECDFVYEYIGSQRYPNSNGTPRSSYDGQWRVWHENLANSLGSPDEPRFEAIDTIVLNNEGSAFDLKWTRFNFKNVPRAADGSVAYSFWNGYSLFEVIGVVENDYLDLIVTWDQHDAATGAVLWHLQDRYTGAPRFQPHLPGNPEPPTGAFNVELAQTDDSCDGVLNTKRYVLESFPVDNGQIQLWLAGLKPPPFTPDSDGTFSFWFDRTDNWYFTYQLDEGVINGDIISFTMHTEALWPPNSGPLSGEIYCTTDYAATGFKRYTNLFPTEQ